MNDAKLKATLEAILFAAGEPVPAARISLVLAVAEEDIHQAAGELKAEYERENRGIRLIGLESSYQLCSAPDYAKEITRVIEHRAPPKLSPPALEALAIIAYFQPVTRAYVEQVRGVDSSYTVSSLAEKGLVEVCGRLEAPGRPALYRTSAAFLRVMGIKELSELPALPDMSSADGVEKLQQAIDELKYRGEQLELNMEETDKKAEITGEGGTEI